MSLYKIQDEIRMGTSDAGIVNPKTGKAPTAPAIEKAAFAYVIRGTPEEVAEARKQFTYLKQTTEAIGVDDEYWGRWMVHMITLYYKNLPRQRQKWIARHGLQKYAEMS